ncbi:MAG: tyrosine-protein kinase, partial [Chloroflexota bacterium]|nr:tyrosine-protein kinase [Chloroflexota bacterium]
MRAGARRPTRIPCPNCLESPLDRHREWAIIRARLPLLLAIVIVPVVGALLFSTVQAKVYEARATLIVGQSLTSMSPDYTGLLASQRLSGTYARVAMTRPVLGRVVTKLGLKQSTDDLLKNVSASAPTDSTLLTIIAHDPDPVEAAAIANALAAELIAASPNLNGRAADVQASVDEDLVATQAQITSVQTE